VLPQAEFDRWLLAQKPGLSAHVDSGGADGPDFRGGLAAHGRRIAAAQGCLKCHTLDGTPHIGPTWLDLYGRQEQLADGRTVIADEAYLTASMMEPLAQVVRGFPQVMPSYRGKLAPPDAAALVELIKALRSDRQQPTPAREAVYEPIPTR
jgi:cytochrome c oxidase subunit II